MLIKPKLLRRFGSAFLPILLFASILSACNFASSTPTLPVSATSTNIPVVNTLAAPTQTVAPSPTASPSPTLAPTPSEVVTPTETLVPTMAASLTTSQATVIADKSASNIRRGPGLAYDITGGLLKGATTAVYGRNPDGTWIYVAIPGQPGKYGWVTGQPQYVTVSVNVMDLPLVAFDQPAPAYIENCTEHTVYVTPGNVSIPDRSNTDNKAQFNPGTYLVFDQHVTDSKGNIVQINTVTLVEG